MRKANRNGVAQNELPEFHVAFQAEAGAIPLVFMDLWPPRSPISLSALLRKFSAAGYAFQPTEHGWHVVAVLVSKGQQEGEGRTPG